jgi:hypothetical protein
VLGHAEIEPQPHIAGQRPDQLLIQRNGLAESALSEQILGFSRLEGERIGRLAGGEKGQKKSESRWE